MDSTTGQPRAGERPQPREAAKLKAMRRSMREAFESLSLAAQFRVTSVAAVTVTMAFVLVIGAIWDTRVARDAALELARTKTQSMAERFEASGGGALDNLEGHPEILAATLVLEDGGVLQRYLRKDLAQRADVDSRDWSTAPGGALHALKAYLALEPLHVASPVQLSRGVTGTVSVVLDHRWIWGHLWHRVGQVPIALLLGCLVAWLAERRPAWSFLRIWGCW